MLQTLGILSAFELGRFAPNSVDAVHLVSEAYRLAYADRARYVADADFVAVPVAGLPGGRGMGEPLRLMVDLDAPVAALRVHRPGGKLVVASDQGDGFVLAEDEALAYLLGALDRREELARDERAGMARVDDLLDAYRGELAAVMTAAMRSPA